MASTKSSSLNFSKFSASFVSIDHTKEHSSSVNYKKTINTFMSYVLYRKSSNVLPN